MPPVGIHDSCPHHGVADGMKLTVTSPRRSLSSTAGCRLPSLGCDFINNTLLDFKGREVSKLLIFIYFEPSN
jgi:hypothetical protein